MRIFLAPQISIIIPVYNSARYLRECLSSICTQSFKNWEIVAVDDGSIDESSKILEEYATDSRIQVIHKKNGGVSAARNDGLAIARGNYILFVDSDDILSDGALQKYWDEVRRTNADVVIADHYSFWENGEKKRYKFFSQNFETRDRDIIEKLQQTMLYGSYSPYYSKSSGYLFAALWTKLFRRSILIENHVNFPERLSLFEDGIFDLLAFENISSVCYIQEPLYNYRILDSSLCHSYKFSNIDLYKKISIEIQTFLKKYNKNFIFQKAYETRFVYYAKKQIGQIFSSRMSFVKKYRESRHLLKDDFYRGFLAKIPGMNLVKNERVFGILVFFRLYFLLALLMQIKRCR